MLVAQAESEGYGTDKLTPFHGYYTGYRRVTWDGLSEGLRGRDRGGGQGKGLRPGYLMEGGPLRKVCGSGYE